MWINTKVEFKWDGTQYAEVACEGYEYSGEIAQCQEGPFPEWDRYTGNPLSDLLGGLGLTEGQAGLLGDDFYDNLSARDTMLYHRGILDKLERKLGARPTSMLTNDDPFFGTDPWTRTEEECEGILKHRQSQWKTHISSAITFYEHVADTLEHRDDIPIIPPRDPTGYS